ncbi:MAG: hypothetical protein JWO86_8215 [Myxococcaceae bacterium]|nr:hypothetical protein [Myxococcaceae bacterium]
MKRLRGLAVATTFLAFTLVASAARAQAVDPEVLFAEGTALVDQQRYAEALPKLEAAQRLDPGIGTQFNIAVCHEKLGRLATAWRTFEEVEVAARAAGKTQRRQAARARLDAIRPRLSVLRVRSDEPDEVLLKIDGVIVPKASWQFWPVDAGDHKVEASAPAKHSWVATTRAPAAGQTDDLVVPRLAVAEGKTTLVSVTDKRRTLGYVLGGVGVLGVAASVVTGLMLLDAKSTADERCAPRCVDSSGKYDPTGADAVSRGKTLLPINAIAWGVAAAGLGAGTYLILTSGKTTTASLGPTVSTNAGGLSAFGSF